MSRSDPPEEELSVPKVVRHVPRIKVIFAPTAAKLEEQINAWLAGGRGFPKPVTPLPKFVIQPAHYGFVFYTVYYIPEPKA